MPRIPYPEPQDLDAGSRALLEQLPELNIFRMLGHHAGVLAGVAGLGNALLLQGSLDPQLREIAIIRTGVLRGSAYEVHQHERLGRELGMSEALLAAIHQGAEAPGLDDLQRQVLRLTDDVVRHSRASDASFQPLAERLTRAQLLELLACIGFYTMICDLLNSLDIPIESAAERPPYPLLKH